MFCKRFSGSLAPQWVETGIIALMLGFLLYIKSLNLAVPDSYGWLWATLSAVTKGLSLF